VEHATELAGVVGAAAGLGAAFAAVIDKMIKPPNAKTEAFIAFSCLGRMRDTIPGCVAAVDAT
jgi:hypothetical protein